MENRRETPRSGPDWWAAERITVAAGVGFAALHHIAERLRGVDFPIELALPWRYAWCVEASQEFDKMVTAIRKPRLRVPTLHATQGRISDQAFLTWGQQTIVIAQQLGARTVTVHPNRARKRTKANLQEIARLQLRRLSHNTTVAIALETFSGKDRVFTPEEIIKAGLPMTLDVAHIHDDRRIMQIIQDYWHNIPVVHLSARGRDEHHLPVDTFCIRVVRKLAALGWHGTIVLEYLPHHHYRLRQDVQLAAQALHREIRPEEIHPPCDAYKGRPDMWDHNTPEPECE